MVFFFAYRWGEGLWNLSGSRLCIAQSNEAGNHKKLHDGWLAVAFLCPCYMFVYLFGSAVNNKAAMFMLVFVYIP